VKFYRYILFLTVCLVIVALAGCSPDESDLTPPNAVFNVGLVTTPTASTTTSVSGTMDPGSTVSVYVTTSATVTGLTQDPVSGTWTFTVNNMVEGANIIQVSVADAVGNTRTIQLTIVVDLTGPVTKIEQYPIITQPGMFTFAGTVAEADSTVLVEVYDSSVSPALVASGTATVDANIWSGSLDLSLLPNGIYTVVATGTDRLGTTRLSTDLPPPAEQVFELDSSRPSFVMITPTPVILAKTIDLQDFAGTTDIDNVLTVTPSFSVNQPVGVVDWSATVSGLAAGNTVVTFEVSDTVLNAEQKVLIVRDQTPPTVVEWSSPDANKISVLFNETMATSTVDTSNLMVVDSTGAAVAVNAVSADLTTKVFTFTTADVLTVGTYTAALQTADPFLIEDGRGNSLGASYVWTFKKY